MEFDLCNHIKFVYRNFIGLKSFNVTKEFVFGLTNEKIIQNTLNSNSFLDYKINIEALRSIIHNDLMYIISKDSIFIFKEKLYYVSARPPLSFDISFENFILSISDKKISIIGTNSLKMIREISFLNDNGLCSSGLIFDKCLVLGFENGKAFIIKKFDEVINNETLKEIKFNEEQRDGFNEDFEYSVRCILSCKETILYINKLKDKIILSTVRDHILKLEEEKNLFKYTKLNFTAKKLCTYKNFVIIFDKKKLFFMDHELKIIAYCHEESALTDMCIVENHLYISYQNSLIISYNIHSIIDYIESSKKEENE